MMGNLFRGYLAPGDKDYVKYIQHQKDMYDNGDSKNNDNLMTLSLNKYKNICTKGNWLAKSPE